MELLRRIFAWPANIGNTHYTLIFIRSAARAMNVCAWARDQSPHRQLGLAARIASCYTAQHTYSTFKYIF